MLIEILVLTSEIVRTFDISCQCYLTWLGWILHCDRWSVVNHTSLISFTWCNYMEREPECNVGAFRQKDIFNFIFNINVLIDVIIFSGIFFPQARSIVIDPLSGTVTLIKKPVNWCAQQIDWLVSIWGQH